MYTRQGAAHDCTCRNRSTMRRRDRPEFASFLSLFEDATMKKEKEEEKKKKEKNKEKKKEKKKKEEEEEEEEREKKKEEEEKTHSGFLPNNPESQ
ncbi:hypothetical protein ElyMa_001336600 [Elysia marginata]|uniref:Uncharacterized protein n=1 Tax=Elysia marginata TaxID=1093978 RepID=A0AAV4IP58_9GAST|nr:hypothetical protein ElyMa_001336600 [Elysia marginata]